MRNRTTTGVGRKVTTALLTLAMALGTLPFAPSVALAGGGKTVESLGTAGIAATGDQFSGSYVYYGKYDGTNPTKYRVLDNDTGAFGGRTMLLDGDTVLETMTYHGSSKEWATSNVKAWVQGDSFLTKQGNFTAQESDAIAASSKDASGYNYGLSGEKAFVLSVGEADQYYANDDAHKKTGGDGYWWLRSAGTSTDSPCAAIVRGSGYVNALGLPVNINGIGVSPAFNVDLSSVIFSSKVSDREYKLTLKDGGLGASGSAALKGTTATVTYNTTGDAATQASWLVTDKAWDADGAQVLGYGRLGEAGAGKTGSFALPGACAADGWGTGYRVYVLAETVSDGNATDYASAPAEVGVPATHAVTVKADPAEGGTAKADPAAVAEGETVKLSATASDGYEFAGWTVVGDGAKLDDASKPEAKLTMGAADVTVTASFRKVEPEPAPAPAKVAKPSTSGHPAKGTLDVSWKAAKGAMSYEVQWRKAGGKWQEKAAKSRELAISGLKKGTLYEVRVRAKAGSAAGKWSPTARRWLRGPSGVKAKPGSKAGAIKVGWKGDRKATGGTKVYVYAKEGGKLVKTAEAEAGKTSATVSGLKAGKRYYVRVRPLRTSSGKTYTGTISGYRAVRAAK